MALTVGCGGWTKRDTALELAAQASLAADWRQTEFAVSTPTYWEGNPIIGDHAQHMSPTTYFAGVGLLHVAIAAILPHGWWRTSFQVATAGVELVQVYENYDHVSSVNAATRKP